MLTLLPLGRLKASFDFPLRAVELNLRLHSLNRRVHGSWLRAVAVDSFQETRISRIKRIIGDMKQTFEFTQDEVLMIVTALGTLKDRIGQKGRWFQRKRLPTLRSRLADCITIGDEAEIEGVRKAMKRTTANIESRIKSGEQIGEMMRRLKEQAGITDERWRSNNHDE